MHQLLKPQSLQPRWVRIARLRVNFEEIRKDHLLSKALLPFVDKQYRG
jgi:hypothetical protein